MGAAIRRTIGLSVLALAAACAGAPPAEQDPLAPYALVLGTAQDGGLPQIGCEGPQCRAAQLDPLLVRRVASLLIVDPRSGQRFLIDATPDLPEQVRAMNGHPATRKESGPRPSLVDGIFLTHAHFGHYTGLGYLGREVYGAKSTPVFASERMVAFLASNGPWDLLVEDQAIDLRPLVPGEPIELGEDLFVTAIEVPHRDEYSDTLAYLIRGPERSILYLPDIDKWERWSLPPEAVLETVDYALLDGTFYADGEIPGRSMAEIPHPFIVESLERFGSLPEHERTKIRFTHLNHTNPATHPESEATARVRNLGFDVARDGDVLPL